MTTLTRALLATALALATITVATTAAATPTGREIEGWPRCVTPYSARVNHLPVTPKGAICATPLRAKPVKGGVEYTRTQWRTGGWEFLGLVVAEDSQSLAADLVRRPA